MVRGKFEPAILQVAGFLAAYSASELLTALLTIFEELVLHAALRARADQRVEIFLLFGADSGALRACAEPCSAD